MYVPFQCGYFILFVIRKHCPQCLVCRIVVPFPFNFGVGQYVFHFIGGGRCGQVDVIRIFVQQQVSGVSDKTNKIKYCDIKSGQQSAEFIRIPSPYRTAPPTIRICCELRVNKFIRRRKFCVRIDSKSSESNCVIIILDFFELFYAKMFFKKKLRKYATKNAKSAHSRFNRLSNRKWCFHGAFPKKHKKLLIS